MSDNTRRQHTKEFKKEAVELVNRGDYTVTEAAKSLGISRTMLDRWRREHRKGDKEAFPGNGHQGAEME